MKPVIIGSAALDELKDAADYYEDRAASMDQAFRVEVVEALERIQRDPELYPAYSRSKY